MKNSKFLGLAVGCIWLLSSVDGHGGVRRRRAGAVAVHRCRQRPANHKFGQVADRSWPMRQREYGEARPLGPVAELVGIEVGVVSGVTNLESSGVEASDWRLRHDEDYHEA